MSTMGLALRCKAGIFSAQRTRERRVEPSKFPGGPVREGTYDASAGNVADDVSLAASCQAGDLTGYERLYSLHGARMKSVARNLLGNQSDAEDAVQDTFLKVQRAISTFRGQSSFVTWTFRILINTCYDARRSRVRKKETSSDETENPQMAGLRAPVGHPTLRIALERALATLTQHQRDVFLLYEAEGFRHSEIAEILQISETASKNTLFQAKKNLRAMLEPPRSADAGAR